MAFQYNRLASREAKFARNKKDAYGKVFTASESEVIGGAIRLSHPNDNWYYKTKTEKTLIILHFTAGLLHGDIGELTKHHVSVPYVVARSGSTYELFHPDYWSYSLGKNCVGGNTTQSKKSIGIEISNYGPLTREGGVLKTLYGQPYCSIDDEEAYVHVADYRGSQYFATYTDEQYKTVDSLITNLCRKYGILRNLPPKDKRDVLLDEAPDEGIWSHQNFRSDKLDPGPAFLWNKISGR